MKSKELRSRHNIAWLVKATLEQIELADAIFAECEAHYSAGGDIIVECYTPAEVVAEFGSVADVVGFCGLKVEQELNARWGEDADPELDRMKAHDEWEKEVKNKHT